MSEEPTQDAEVDEIVAVVEDADKVESYVNDDGQPALRLSERGARWGARWR
ncbi:MAG TPA: hypothetical protein VJZ50_02820 [Candidatus Limnocylindrales bacterium]|nr:hypothetical protein [Candidatus Limnocylindrales bacterium]